MTQDIQFLKEVLSVPTKTYKEDLMIQFIEDWMIKNNIEYYVDGLVANEIFENCFSYKTKEEALEHARKISNVHRYTDDGICIIKYANNLTFGELIENGKNTRR